MQLLESNFGHYFIIGLVVITMLLVLLLISIKNKKDDIKIIVTDNPKEEQSAFWDFNQTYLVAYMVTSIAIEDRNTDLIKLIYNTVGRSKGAIDRKVSRFINVYSSNNGLSVLDREVYDDVTEKNDFMAFSQFIKCYEKLGGDSDELLKALN